MLGGGAPQEDMFAKLEQMRGVITEVNTQFKDPVSCTLLVARLCCYHLLIHRKRRHLSACASQSFCRSTRLSD